MPPRKPKRRAPKVVIANRPLSGVHELMAPVRRFVDRSKGPAVLLAQEIYAPRFNAIPSHRENVREIRRIQAKLRGRPGLRVVFSAQEKGVWGYPYMISYAVSAEGYDMALKRHVAEGEAQDMKKAAKLRGRRGGLREAFGIWEKRRRRFPRELTFNLAGQSFVVRPCLDGAAVGGKKGHILLVPAYNLPDRLKMSGSRLGVVADAGGLGHRVEMARDGRT